MQLSWACREGAQGWEPAAAFSSLNPSATPELQLPEIFSRDFFVSQIALELLEIGTSLVQKQRARANSPLDVNRHRLPAFRGTTLGLPGPQTFWKMYFSFQRVYSVRQENELW